MARKSAAAAPRVTSNLPATVTLAQLSEESTAIAARIGAATGDRIRAEGNLKFILPDGSEGQEIECVVLDFVTHNLFYDRAYDPKNPIPPACFAIGPEPTVLTPSPNSPDVQAETCAGCVLNQFKTALNGGNGKGCKNTRLIAVIPLVALDEPEREHPIWTLSVPPASLASFDGYVRTLMSKHKTIPIGVVTSISLGEGQYFSPRFAISRPLQQDELNFFYPRRAEATARILSEPDVTGYEPPPAARGRPAAKSAPAKAAPAKAKR